MKREIENRYVSRNNPEPVQYKFRFGFYDRGLYARLDKKVYEIMKGCKYEPNRKD